MSDSAFRLQDKTALVTGASRGIGYSIAEAFARQGAKLLINARNPESLEAAAEKLRAHGVQVETFACDVADREAVIAMVAYAINTLGQIDILVNNAGVYKPAPFLGYSFEDFSHVVQTNLYSVFHMTQAVLPGMIERKRGRIINVASTAGKWGSRNQSAYNASKHAVVGLTRCVGLEMAGHGITVNAICPWIVETDLKQTFMKEQAAIYQVPEAAFIENVKNSVPLRRYIEPEEVAHMAVYLASDEASYITCQAWTVDGGYTMI